jgi:hypothetical protein
MTYNPKSGNPFNSCDPNKEWTNNNLILQDPKLRKRAGVTILDHNVSEMFPCNGAQAQVGGGAIWAPFAYKWFGKTGELLPYENPDQQGGMPYHYYDNNKKW